MERPSDPVVIGSVGPPHGVRGTVRVKALGSGRHLRRGVKPLIGDRRLRILSARSTPKGFLLDLEGVGDRSEAAALRGEDLVLDRSELDEPEEEEFYVADLVGLTAVDDSGVSIGTVEESFETPAHEVLVVRAGGEETYVPFTFEHIPEVDLEGGSLTVSLPEEQSR